MGRSVRLLPALCAFFVLAATLAACGDSVPGNAVARVDDDLVTTATFKHWIAIAAATSQGAGAAKASYDPPDFTACVAKKAASAPKPAKGVPKPTTAQFKSQCQKEYEGLRDQVMQFLISDRWIRGEAADQGIKLSGKELDAEFAKVKKQSFPKEADFQKFLKGAGMTLADAKLQVRFNTISNKLREKVTKDSQKVTDKQVAAYYAKNRKTFAQPEKRDLRIVLTKTKAKASQALAALKGGRSWKSVAKQYSIDAQSKAQGGSLKGVPKGQQEKSFDDAVFSAPKGKLIGPAKAQFGFYVFQIQKVVAPTQQPLKQVSAQIKQQLLGQSQQKAIQKFSDSLRKKWKARTNCRDGFITQDCKNAPKLKTTATAPGQAAQPPTTAP